MSVKAGENELFEFHTDFHTGYIERKLKEVGWDGLSFPRFSAYLVVPKPGVKAEGISKYIIMDEKKIPVMELSGDPYEIDFKLMMLRDIYKDRMNLVKIAETGSILVQ